MKKLSVILSLAIALGAISSTSAMFGPTGAYLRAGLLRGRQLARQYPLQTGGATVLGLGGTGYATHKTLKGIQDREHELMSRQASYQRDFDNLSNLPPIAKPSKHLREYMDKINELHLKKESIDKQLKQLRSSWPYFLSIKLSPWKHQAIKEDVKETDKIAQEMYNETLRERYGSRNHPGTWMDEQEYKEHQELIKEVNRINKETNKSNK